MSDVYVCAELIDGVCKTWVLLPPSPMQSLMITKDTGIAIAKSLAGIYGIIVAFLMIAKGAKSA